MIGEDARDEAQRILAEPQLDDAALPDGWVFGTPVKVCRICGGVVFPDPVDAVEPTDDNPAPTAAMRHVRWHALVAGLVRDALDRGVEP